MDEIEIQEIDGSVLEGGGQILRISIGLSAILGIPVRVTKIRANRPKPGLAAQHLKGIQLVAQMCDARLKGAHIGSTEVEFIPGRLKGGHFLADTQTAGSISLLLQVALPCALFAPTPVRLELRGGTNADMAPQIDYMDKVFRPTLRQFGADFSLEIVRRGYYPRGGGHVIVNISPVRSLRAVRLMERGDVTHVAGWSFVAGSLPIHMANSMAHAARQQLSGVAAIDIHAYKEDRDVARDNCFGILLQASTSTGAVLGADALGKKDVDAGYVGAAAAKNLRAAIENGACLDERAQDQVIVYMALADGQSSVRVGEVTLHTRTAIHVAQLLTYVRFDVIPLSDQNVIQCNGIGFTNRV